MPATNRSRHLAVVHPSSTSRIERKSAELKEIQEQAKALEERRKELTSQLLKMVKAEGEEDEKGKLRYTTDSFRYVVVGGSSVHTSGDKAIQILQKMGVKLELAKKAIAKATSRTEYEYVRVDKVMDVADDTANEPTFPGRRRG